MTIFLRTNRCVFFIKPNITFIISFINIINFDIFKIPLTYQHLILTFFLLLNVLLFKILLYFNFVIDIVILTQKLSKFYSNCVNEFCPSRTCVRQKQYMRVWSPLSNISLFYCSNRTRLQFKLHYSPLYKHVK